MDENLINQTTEEYNVEEDIQTETIDVPAEDVEQEIVVNETEHSVSVESEEIEVTVEPNEEFTIDISESIGWVSGDNRYHDSLLGVDSPNQHPIAAIIGLREELDEVERLKTVYSDQLNIANYYEWADAAYDDYGYFVSLVPGTSTIQICNGTDIFGVSVEVAGFIGGQDGTVPRNQSYGLIVTSGMVDVRCELDVAVGDYVISNAYGYAKKSDSNYGYKVLALEIKDSIKYAVISLSLQADVIHSIGAELHETMEQVDANYKNIISAVNVANQAYNKAHEVETSNQIMSGQVNVAIGKVDKMESDVASMGDQVSSSVLAAAQAKAIAESAAVSAESMRNEAIEEANKALAETSELRKEFEANISEINTDLENSALELNVTKENLNEIRTELKGNIDDAVRDLEDLERDLEPLATWPNGSNTNRATALAGFVARADDDSATLASVTKFEGEFGKAISGFVQEATKENVTVKAIAEYQQKDADGKVISDGAAGLISQVDANKSAIDLLVNIDGDGYAGLAGLTAQVDANKSSVATLASHIVGEFENTDDWVADNKDTTKVYYAKNNKLYYYYDNENSAWKSTDKAYEAGLKGALAGTQQIADANTASIESIVAWQGETDSSIAAVKQTADQNSADILLTASWKSEVENDVASIAGIKATADANAAIISQLTQKDTELSTTIAGVKTTADTNKASIEQITEWKSNVNPTISSVAGIKQTADGNAASITGLTSWKDETNIAMARIEQKADANGAYIQSTVSNMNKYSVGPHSQAYGFTLEQAASVLEEGMIYVPTVSVTEQYEYTDDDEVVQKYTRNFTPQYLYKWGKVNGQYRWITVDKNYTETTETNTSSKAVYFTTTEPSVSDNFGYWYTNGNTITSTSGTYEPHTLYKWESYVDENKTTQYHWIPVATLAGNSQNRAVSQIRQDANSIELSVTALDGKYAGTKAWVDENKSAIQETVTWNSNNAQSITTFMQTAGDNFASASQVAKIVDEDGNVNAASIVTAVNQSNSSVVINADHIKFDGFVSFASKDDVKEVQDNSVYDTEVEYALSSSLTSFVKVTDWSTTAPPWQAEAYMWQRITITKGDGTKVEGTPTCIHGASGNSVRQITQDVKSYTYSEIMTWVGDDDGWWDNITISDFNPGDTCFVAIHVTDRGNAVGYMRCEITDYDPDIDGGTLKTKCLDFMMGPTGTDAPKVVSEKKQFYLSTSDTSLVGGSWSDDTPSGFTKEKYLWTRSVYTMEDDSTIEGAGVLDRAYTNISSWCMANDTTLINGARIATGTINAESIDASTISALNLVVGENVAMGENATISWGNIDAPTNLATTSDVSNAKLDVVDEINSIGYQTSDQVTEITRNVISTATINADQINVNGDLSAFGATIAGWNITEDALYKQDESGLFSGMCTASFDDDGVSYILKGESYNVAGYTGKARGVRISSIHDGRPVKIIEANAFKGCESVVIVEIPDGVTSIGSGAFEDCSRLRNVMLPESITTIRHSAFSGCSSLENIVIPGSVKSIGDSAFEGCSRLKSITAPFVGRYANTTDYLGSIFGAVYSSYSKDYVPASLKTVTITGGNKIGSDAFKGCSSLTDITIPGSVTSIGAGAFRDCTSLENITIPFVGESISAQGYKSHFGYIFGSTYSNSKPDSYHYLDNSTSRYYTYYIPQTLKNVTITGGNSIVEQAFYGCTSLESVTIPRSVMSIGHAAVAYCDSMTSITIPNTVGTIDYDAFYECPHLTCYCESSAKPYGWSVSWNNNGDNVVWGCDIDDMVAVDDNSATIGVETIAPRLFAGSTSNIPYLSSDANMVVSEDGKLYASSARIEGEIYATNGSFSGKLQVTSGKIGGLEIGEDNISSQSSSLAFTKDGRIIAEKLELTNALTTDAILASKISGRNKNSPYFLLDGTNINSVDVSVTNISWSIEKEGTTNWLGYIKNEGKVNVTITFSEDITIEQTFKIYACYYDDNDSGHVTSVRTISSGNTVSASFPHLYSWSRTISDYGASHTYNYVGKFSSASVTPSIFAQPSSSATPSIIASTHFVPLTNEQNLGAPKNVWNYIYRLNESNGSDRKIKDNISEIDGNFSKQLIDGLSPKSYIFKTAKTPRTHYGFIAQEVEELLHSLGTSADEVGIVCKSLPGEPDGENNYYGLNYTNLIAPMVSVIQQLSKRVEELENKLNTEQND